MTEPMDVLYKYAEEHMVCGLLEQEREYVSASRCAEKQERAFLALVGEEHGERLEAMLDERKLLSFFEGQALFQAGFQIALELTR